MMTKQELEKNARQLEELQAKAEKQYVEAMWQRVKATQSAADATTKSKRIHIQLMRLRGELAMVEDE